MTTSVTRANVEATKAFIRARLGNPYVYGGALSLNVKQGTDCSEVCQTALEMALGRWVQGRQSEGATTESYRYIPIGGVGPFGTIRVANWRDIPANAAARIALHHGPGGGANSHMWMELDGMRIESGGSKGLVTGDRALAIENSYATAWCYLPGPIDGVAGPVTLGIGSTGPEVVTLQQRLNTEGAGLEVDGEYGPDTAAAFAAFNSRVPYAQAVMAEGQRRGITPRGIQVAFSVVFVESNWKMYANSKVPESIPIPHDAVGSDYDSVGLFQQRCPMWGPAQALMNPTLSAGLFYDRLAKLDYNNPNRLPGDYAADVQRPDAQYRGRYQERMGDAVALYNRLATSAPPAQGDDFMSALSPDEQREMLTYLRWAFAPDTGEFRKQFLSRSAVREVDEGTVDTISGMELNTDGNVDLIATFLRAWLRYPPALARLQRVAKGEEPGRSEDDALIAQAILAAVTPTKDQP